MAFSFKCLSPVRRSYVIFSYFSMIKFPDLSSVMIMHQRLYKVVFIFSLLFLMPGPTQAQRFYTNIFEVSQKMEKAISGIPAQRKDTLMLIGDTLLYMMDKKGKAEILFTGITDGSLTQLAQIWLYTALHYHKIKSIGVYSGGLRPDAINYRVVAALKRTGFNIQPVRGYANNPVYFFNLGRSFPDYTIFAKAIDYHYNPHEDYLVVPLNPDVDHLDYSRYGATVVIPYHWKRPDIWDDTQVEAMKYDEYCREIGRDMFFLAHYINLKIKEKAQEQKRSRKKKKKDK